MMIRGNLPMAMQGLAVVPLFAGFDVDEPDPAAYAAAARRVFDEPLAAERLSTASVLRARQYTWRAAAHALVELHDELAAGHLVECG